MNETTPARLSTKVFEEVIDNGQPDLRAKLARELAQFMCDPAAPADEQREVIPCLMRLSQDPVKEVRAVLARGLRRCQGLDADLVFSIVADDDDIALPFLAATPTLDAWRMKAILKVGDHARQVAIAARRDVTAEAATMIAGASQQTVAAVLLDNLYAPLDATHFRKLYQRFGEEPEIVERLLAVPHLPAEIRLLQAKRSSRRLQEMMREKGWMARPEAEEIIADAEEKAVLTVLADAPAPDLDKLIEFLSAKDMLTSSLILRAACTGQMTIVEHALGFLASLPAKRVAAVMHGGGVLPIRALFKAAGLPESCYDLLRASLEVMRDGRARGETLDPETFGARLVETLMTKLDTLTAIEMAALLDLVSKLAADRARSLAKRLQADFVKAA